MESLTSFLIEHWFILIGLILLLVFPYLFPKFNRHKHNQKKAKRVLKKIRSFQGKAVEARIFGYLRKIDPFVFEELLLTAFEEKGYKSIRNKRYTGDGGVDGRLVDKKNRLILVQAKRYSGHIQKSQVVEFSQLVKSDKKAIKGYFVHTGRTGRSVYDGLENVRIISGESLLKIIAKPSLQE